MDKPLRSQGGQMILEAILILVVLFGATLFIAEKLKSEEAFASVISKPWKSIAGMLENGYWEAPEASRTRHPNKLNRHISIKAKDI
ncbi:MAG: hypothetical protein KDD61_14155 [Bdellovibrionales bacterium]|nr:hypothetical protein [Bdellovibrionales bacterium]